MLAAASAGSKIVFAGGSSSTASYSKTVDIYDVSTNTWTTAQLSEGRAGLAGAGYRNKIYFGGGGSASSNASTTVDIYDVTTNTWTTSNLPQGRRFLAATSTNGKILFIGGTDKLEQASSAVDVYDVATGKWSSYIDHSAGWYEAVAMGNGGKVVVAGGFNASATTFDTTNQTFSGIGFDYSYDFPALAAAGRKIFLAGGNKSPTTVAVYDRLTGNWDKTFPISEGRSSLAGGGIADQVVFAGGVLNYKVSDVVDIYTLTK